MGEEEVPERLEMRTGSGFLADVCTAWSLVNPGHGGHLNDLVSRQNSRKPP